jgi:hypothetical protein
MRWGFVFRIILFILYIHVNRFLAFSREIFFPPGDSFPTGVSLNGGRCSVSAVAGRATHPQPGLDTGVGAYLRRPERWR